MKMRFPGVTAKMALEALGATPVGIAPADQFVAINTGVVDGTIISPGFLVTSKIYEITKYMLSGFPMYLGAQLFVMSEKTWKSLPLDVQLIMQDLGDKAKYQYLAAGQQQDIDSMNKLRGAGLEIYSLNPDELKRFQKSIEVVANQWVSDMQASGFPGKEALETTKQVLERYKW
jgi:TRAP-type C4-dicarboxylate transport system substrate-binding protein